MPRQERLKEPGIYHIINRGVERRDIFLDTQDYEFFLELLTVIQKKYKVIIHTFCCMTNHYHVLLETTTENLPQAIQYLNDKYAKNFNKKYSRSGHLWQGRYKSYALYDDAHFWIVAKYIERNPLKANMVKNIQEYHYHSFYQWKNKAKYYDLLEESKIFDMTLKEYEEYLSSDMQSDAIDIVYQSPKLVKVDGKYKSLQKRVETFFEFDRDINRNKNIVKAFEYGYSKSDIAHFLKLSPSTISKIIN
jgi:REP element-mobilizing transposase RayT